MAVLHPHTMNTQIAQCAETPACTHLIPALHPRLRKQAGSPLACSESRSIHNVLMKDLSELDFLLKASHAPFWSGFLKSLYA